MVKDMKSDARIRLAYLDESERNPTYFSWDAKDTSSNDYHITYRYEILAVSGPDGFWIERENVSRPDAPSAKDEIIQITSDIFDASLLESGTPCVCGFVNEPAIDPRFCVNCEVQLRPCKIVSIKVATKVMPSWLAERTYAPYCCWKGEDEDGSEVWILWHSMGLEVFTLNADVDAEIEPEMTYASDVSFPEGYGIEALAELEAELFDLYSFHGIDYSSVIEEKTEEGIICHIVKVSWRDGSREAFRYDTREQAESAARFHFENSGETSSSAYVGPRFNWRYIFSLGRLLGRW